MLSLFIVHSFYKTNFETINLVSYCALLCIGNIPRLVMSHTSSNVLWR